MSILNFKLQIADCKTRNSKVRRSGHPFFFFSKAEQKEIIAAIQAAEQKASGEIRVHLERKAHGDILEQAKQEFERLGMTKTRERNGVLIFLCTASQHFAIIGDAGIDQNVAATFWSELAARMGQQFAQDQFADGIVDAICVIGDLLKQYFPYQRDDINELPDAISYSL